MSKDEILNKLYNEKLNIDELLDLYNEMKKYSFSEFDYNVLNDYINDRVKSIKSLELLKEVKRKFKKSGYNTLIVNKFISEYKSVNEGDLSFLGSNNLSNLINNRK